MRFDTSQQMKLGQQMKLAPRMIQSMEILQLPLAALEERIEQELESNVTLETVEPGSEEEAGEREAEEPERELTTGENLSEDFERLDSFESSYEEAVENEYSSAASGHEAREYEPSTFSPSRMAGERDGKMDAMANTEARAASLTDQLLEQWSLVDIDEDLHEIGELLINHIDADGFIRTDLAQVLEGARQRGMDVDRERLERALMAVQLVLDPPGIAARSVPECLVLQLDAIEEEEGSSPTLERARMLIEKHYDDLIHNRLPRVAERTGLTIDQINEAVELMKRLRLHPGRELVEDRPPTITPDAIVEYDDDRDEYYAYLTDGRLPHLRINQEYARMAKDRDVPKRDRDFVRTNLSNAQWLIEAINQRRQTLLRVINVVVAAQRDFFDQGPSALRPLPMTQVADQLGVHVATVSRAVAGKYLQTPRGVYPLRKFFSGGTQTEGGEDLSWEAIRAAMREVVDNEDKTKPLSDEAISKSLKERGIDIARRTVAKYRGQLDIPPARMRKQYD